MGFGRSNGEAVQRGYSNVQDLKKKRARITRLSSSSEEMENAKRTMISGLSGRCAGRWFCSERAAKIGSRTLFDKMYKESQKPNG